MDTRNFKERTLAIIFLAHTALAFKEERSDD
jgi:hypothetical protein